MVSHLYLTRYDDRDVTLTNDDGHKKAPGTRACPAITAPNNASCLFHPFFSVQVFVVQ